MALRATKKQIRYKNTHSQDLGGSVPVLCLLSAHNPRDQNKVTKGDKGEYFGELRRCMERLKQTKTDIIFVVTIITSDYYK